MKLGITRSGSEVRISPDAENRHVVIFGKSGTGKSVRKDQIIEDAANQGKTIIAFDLEKVPSLDGTLKINRIDAVKDGINLQLLDKSAVKAEKETEVGMISYITELLTGSIQMGSRQMGVLREAVKNAIEYREQYETDLSAINNCLQLIGTPIAEGVRSKLWTLLESDVFKKSEKKILPGHLNVYDLGGLPESIQTVTIELIVGLIWRQAVLRGPQNTGNEEEVIIVIDEFQRLMLKKHNVINTVLEQGRKYEMTLILATQSANYVASAVKDHLDGVGIMLYFQPRVKETRKIAELIDYQKVDYYTILLNKLSKGQSFVLGKITVDGCRYEKPMVIQSVYDDACCNSMRGRKHYLEMKSAKCV